MTVETDVSADHPVAAAFADLPALKADGTSGDGFYGGAAFLAGQYIVLVDGSTCHYLSAVWTEGSTPGYTDVPSSTAAGWPTIEELAAFAQADVADPILQQCLDDSIAYGELTLGVGYAGPVNGMIHRAAMTYAATNFTERIANADLIVDALSGPTAMSRYRRSLLASRFTAIA